MDKESGWRYFGAIILVIILAVLAGDFLLGRVAPENQLLANRLRPGLYLGGLAAGLLCGAVFWVARRRVVLPLDSLVRNLKQHIEGGRLSIESLHQSNDISPLLYSIEVLINSYALQIQDAEGEGDTLRSVLNQITDGIVMINDSGEVSSLNPAAEAIFKIGSAEARGRSVAEVLRHHQWIELYRDCLDSGLECSTTLEIPSQKTFLQGIAIPPGENLPGYTLLVFQDLSQIRRLETTRQDFISNISHELRTPLASLKALTETLQDGALDDPQAARRFLDRMDTEVDALTQMVAELLELSRIESGRVPLDLNPVLPEKLLDNAVERMKAQAQRKNLNVATQTSDQLRKVRVDARRIEQVLVNLLHNAIKFSDLGGAINLAAQPENGGITFSVEDFGTGIAEADLERIFERFYKIDQARSTRGTGLGLSIAKHIVEAHQGRIWAESTLNQGSRFFFWLPLDTGKPG